MDATFVAFVALVLFLGLLIYLKIPGMIGGMLDKRADQIKVELEEARRLREEAQSLLAEYQRKARDAEKEAESIVTQAKTDAEFLARESKIALEEMIQRRTRLAEQKIAQAEAGAVADVRAAASDAAVTAASSVLRDAASGKAANNLFKQSLEQIKANLN